VVEFFLMNPVSALVAGLVWAMTQDPAPLPPGQVARFDSGHRAEIRSLAFSPAGDHLASASEDGTLCLWDAARGRNLFRMAGHGAGLTSVSFSPDGRRLLSASRDRTARLWDASSGQELRSFEGNKAGLSSALISPNGPVVATGSYDGLVRLFDESTGTELARLEGHSHAVTGLEFCAWNNSLVSSSYDFTIRSWDLGRKQETAQYSIADAVHYAMAFSPDGQYVAAASIGRMNPYAIVPEQVLTVWEVSSGRKLASSGTSECRGPAQGQLSFSADGRRICLLREGTLRLWDPARGQEPPVALKTGAISAFRFSPGGATVALGMTDFSIEVWKGSLVSPPVDVRELAAEDVRKRWDDLAGKNPEQAFRGARALADSPEAAVEFLRKQLVPVTLEEVERLVARLDDDDARVRDQAALQLQVAGTPELLGKILERNPPLETALRVKALIAAQQQHKTGSPELTRVSRAIGILEQAGTKGAKALLEKLAGGSDSARQTLAARSALERLNRREGP
jgi:WD40 repeat protein